MPLYYQLLRHELTSFFRHPISYNRPLLAQPTPLLPRLCWTWMRRQYLRLVGYIFTWKSTFCMKYYHQCLLTIIWPFRHHSLTPSCTTEPFLSSFVSIANKTAMFGVSCAYFYWINTFFSWHILTFVFKPCLIIIPSCTKNKPPVTINQRLNCDEMERHDNQHDKNVDSALCSENFFLFNVSTKLNC